MGGEFLGREFFRASFAEKTQDKKFDPRIRVQNSGIQNSFPRIRPQVRVPEVRNPLCGNVSLKEESSLSHFEIEAACNLNLLSTLTRTIAPLGKA